MVNLRPLDCVTRHDYSDRNNAHSVLVYAMLTGADPLAYTWCQLFGKQIQIYAFLDDTVYTPGRVEYQFVFYVFALLQSQVANNHNES